MIHPTPYLSTNKPPHRPRPPQRGKERRPLIKPDQAAITSATVASRGSTGDGGEFKGCWGTRAQRVASERGQDTTGEQGRKRRW
eukprot:CAMPEP_0201616974 /NCGR_PEP_ID=MMETSP0492-20130828/35173_1 /ASSEMBLY_ACC=CAM_ASM_000837 /TAXON_ID=420259 /ORGANISM="Thalassiosira gravida, Strain GMp14c1" /LENGTH=83 /DNA_ID=CAMNT_0048085083 /DNA_START=377 /DNA_END=625 /DNA_ORIENTATION=-